MLIIEFQEGHVGSKNPASAIPEGFPRETMTGMLA